MTPVFDVLHLCNMVLIVTSGFFAIRFRELFSAVIALAMMSLLLALEFYILHAPDVAMAEAAVGAGLTVAIFIIAIRKTEGVEVAE